MYFYCGYLLLSIIVLQAGVSSAFISTRTTTNASWDPFMAGLFSTPQVGDGTYYGSDSGGTCTLDGTRPAFTTTSAIHATVALNIASWDNSIPCGMCANVTASGQGSGANPIMGNFLVFVNNQCPSCSTGDLDFALNGDGRWAISWVGVECPVGDSNIQYMFVGSNPYYLKLQVRNTIIPALNLYILQGDNYVALLKTNDNFFTTLDSSAATPIAVPLSLKIESVAGSIVYDSIASIGADNTIIQGSVQFPSISGAPPPPSSTGGDKIVTDDASTVCGHIAVFVAFVLSLLM